MIRCDRLTPLLLIPSRSLKDGSDKDGMDNLLTTPNTFSLTAVLLLVSNEPSGVCVPAESRSSSERFVSRVC